MTSVILDTDIGGDIDDTWALAMLLGCPELDLRLVVSATGDTTYRARVAAGILSAGGRDEIPVGIGVPTAINIGGSEGASSLEDYKPQAGFAREVDLDGYPGGVHQDGVQALIDCIMESPEPVTVIAIGPVTNIGAALDREPAIAQKARLVGMLGNTRVTTKGSGDPMPEYNVLADVPACRAAFAAPWDVTITPLDTCGAIMLKDKRYDVIRSSDSPLLQAVMRNYQEWFEAGLPNLDGAADSPERSAWLEKFENVPEAMVAVFDGIASGDLFERGTSILFDTVAVYLAYDESLLNLESLPIALDDDGTMRVTPGASELRVATSWRDAEAFADHLLQRLTS